MRRLFREGIFNHIHILCCVYTYLKKSDTCNAFVNCNCKNVYYNKNRACITLNPNCDSTSVTPVTGYKG